jgi:8-oxo-dGTP diphosphatase
MQAEQVVPVIGSYGVERVVSSSSRRCWATVGPYADVADLDLEVTDDLSEEDATPKAVAQLVSELLARPEPAVMCTHRKVLPHVFAALDLPDLKLEPGEMIVVHHRRGRPLAVERHPA